MKPGPDPSFPYLDASKHFQFPPSNEWKGNIISIGGNLSPGLLLSAYEQGIFPWYGPKNPVLWQSPDPRCVIFPDKLHVSDSMKKILKKNVYKITYDEDFNGVIRGCADTKRPRRNKVAKFLYKLFAKFKLFPKLLSSGTWVTNDIIEAYTELHRLGWAHSAEAWLDGELVGGCYGILLGRIFCGESMFAKAPNASKAAFLSFAKLLFDHGVACVDCQVPSDYLMSLGGEEMSRKEFLELIKMLRVFRY